MKPCKYTVEIIPATGWTISQDNKKQLDVLNIETTGGSYELKWKVFQHPHMLVKPETGTGKISCYISVTKYTVLFRLLIKRGQKQLAGG